MSAILGISTAIIGGVLILYAVIAGFLAKGLRAPTRRIPVLKSFTPFMALVVIGAIGFALGGLGVLQSWSGDVFGGATASVTGIGGATTIGETALQSCLYSAGNSDTGYSNLTIRADTADPAVVWADVDESLIIVAAKMETAGIYEGTFNFSVKRAGSIAEDGKIQIVANSPDFSSENDPSSATTYNILEIKGAQSSYYTGKNQREVYLKMDNQASTSSDIESVDLTYTEGVASRILSVTLELDQQAFSNLNNYSVKPINLYQRTSAGDTLLPCKINVMKVP